MRMLTKQQVEALKEEIAANKPPVEVIDMIKDIHLDADLARVQKKRSVVKDTGNTYTLMTLERKD